MDTDTLRKIFAGVAMSDQPSLRYKLGKDALPWIVCDTEALFEGGPQRLFKKEMEAFLLWLNDQGFVLKLVSEQPRMAKRELSFYSLDPALWNTIADFPDAFAEADEKDMNIVAGIAADISCGFDNMESYGVEYIINGRDKRFEFFVMAENYRWAAQGLSNPNPILR